MAATPEPLSAPNFGAGQVQGRKGVAQVIGVCPDNLRPLKSLGEHLIGREHMKKKATAKKPPEQKEPEKKKAFERTYRGGCHCGRIRFEVRGVLDRVSECNCSICTKKGYVHWIVPRSTFRLK